MDGHWNLTMWVGKQSSISMTIISIRQIYICTIEGIFTFLSNYVIDYRFLVTTLQVPVTVNQDGCNSNIDINFIFTGYVLCRQFPFPFYIGRFLWPDDKYTHVTFPPVGLHYQEGSKVLSVVKAVLWKMVDHLMSKLISYHYQMNLLLLLWHQNQDFIHLPISFQVWDALLVSIFVRQIYLKLTMVHQGSSSCKSEARTV